MIGRSGEIGSGISMLAARHDDDVEVSICTVCYFSFGCYCYFTTFEFYPPMLLLVSVFIASFLFLMNS